MSRCRLLSKSGDGLALALRIADEGNKVNFWVKNAKAKASYKGILAQIQDWRYGLKKDMIILFDMVGLGSIAEQLKKAGFQVYGAGKLNDRLELDREFGMKLAEISGLKVPEYKTFKSFSKAIEFVTKSDKVWVFKPTDNASPAYTYVSTDKEDLIEMLSYFQKIWKGKVEFILQEKIEGVELSCERFYVNGEPVSNSLNSTLEVKRFMDGDNGPQTGCQGSVVWFWKQTNPKIYRLGLKKVEPFLKRFKYNAPLDVNCIISDKDKLPYFCEFSSRIGYNAIYALCEGLNMEVGKFFSDMASGQIPKLSPSYDWLGAVRLSIPPYPNEQGVEKSAGKPIRGIDSLDHIWLLDAKLENDSLLTAGVDGVVAEVTGKAKTLDELGRQIYGRIGKLKIPDAQFRTDCIENAKERLAKLKEWKFF